MGYLAKNNAYSTLAASISDTASQLIVQTGHGDRFPVIAGTDFTLITLEDAAGRREICKLTARAAASDVLDIERAQEGTTALSWNAGDLVELRMTAALVQEALGHVTDPTAAHAASAISFTPAGSIAATDVQAAIEEVASDAAAATSAAITAHEAAADPHPQYEPEQTPASKAEMETGTEPGLRSMSPLRVAEAIAALAPEAFPSGTRLSFPQTSAPPGWTKDTTAAINDSIMRLVTGTAGSGGSLAFSAFAGQTATGAHTLTTAQMPSHTHSVQGANDKNGSNGASAYATDATKTTSATGGGGSHSHTLSQDLKYYDFIIASKD